MLTQDVGYFLEGSKRAGAPMGFSFYLENFANYSVIYGSLGAAFALLLYFYISAAALLLGAEVNAAIYH